MSKILAILAAGLLVGAMAAQAKLPAAPPMSDADKAAKAEKDAAAKAKDAADLGKAQDRAVANYKKNHASMGKDAAKAKK
jgi:hypothetical protein